MIHAPGVNLARRPFRNNVLLYSAFGFCGLLLLAGTIYNIWEFRQTGTQLEELRSEIGLIDERHKNLADEVEKVRQEIRAVDLTSFNARADFANGLLLSKFFSWSELFDLLEDVMPPEVKLRSIRPAVSAQRIEIQVDGLAKTPMALYEFQKALDADGHFANVYPLSENTRETKGELNFDLIMDYLPGGVEEERAASGTDTAHALMKAAAEQAAAPSGTAAPPSADPNSAAAGSNSAAAGSNADAADPNAEDDGWDDDWDEDDPNVAAELAPAPAPAQAPAKPAPQPKKPASPNGAHP